ncbi:hypothetical protein Clacol_009039 [Clathrus columnatus]|uniref:Translation initiation factor IF2/IF5 domain-containing protein n=1 Tax=Clathrus columnatus TaxID=1419009 RepID=A0AAV5APF3_9AGAM|nr:hypothetical protein Clacol_009039 [Clathrus columnatus]
MEEPLFDPSLKKRKNKKTVAFEDPLGPEADPTTPIPFNGDDAPTLHEQMVKNGLEVAADSGVKDNDEDDFKAMFGDGKKKKKKKKEIPFDLEETSGTSTPSATPAPIESTEPTVDAVTDEPDFSDIKKKKKKSKKAAFDLEAFEKELGDTQGVDGEDGVEIALGDDEDLGENPFAAPSAGGMDSGREPWLGFDRDYTYPELLHRFFNLLHTSNPALLSASGKRYTIVPPNIQRDGTKKSVFTNVTDICRRMHRQPDHVIQFLFSELGTNGSVDGAGRLVIKGRFQQKQIENVLRRYIVEYVTCKTCKSPDTLLEKENRIDFVSCQSCGSRRSVSAIKSGFKAQVGKRKKAA